jgi:hypothetical protein
VKLKQLTIDNDLWLEFNDTMNIFYPVPKGAFDIKIKGSRETYDFDYEAHFVNGTHLYINMTIGDRLWSRE